MKKTTLYLTRGGLIAALYVVLTLLSSLVGLASGAIQFRLSEALCILPVFFPEAVIALTIGCFLSNLLMGSVIWDIVFGTLATFLGALGAYLLRKTRRTWLLPIPTVLANVLIIPPIIVFFAGGGGAWSIVPAVALGVGIGEVVCAHIGGMALYNLIMRTKILK